MGEMAHSVAATEAKQMLTYFRQARFDSTLLLLSNQVKSFFTTLSRFGEMMRTAFVEVERQREMCHRRNMPDPVSVLQGAPSKVQSRDQMHFQAKPTAVEPAAINWKARLVAQRHAKKLIAEATS